MRSDFHCDLERYRKGGKLLWYEPSLWAIAVYRIGRSIQRLKPSFVGRILRSLHVVVFSVVTLLTGIHIPRSCRIGAGLKIWHFGGIFVSPDAVIGARCTLRQGVTIGNRLADHDVPVIGDDVEIGVGALLLGDIRIGHRAVIGAGAVVLHDVPDDYVAVGNPARNLPKRRRDTIPATERKKVPQTTGQSTDRNVSLSDDLEM